jgi:hypothetical protein
MHRYWDFEDDKRDFLVIYTNIYFEMSIWHWLLIILQDTLTLLFQSLNGFIEIGL